MSIDLRGAQVNDSLELIATHRDSRWVRGNAHVYWAFPSSLIKLLIHQCWGCYWANICHISWLAGVQVHEIDWLHNYVTLNSLRPSDTHRHTHIYVNQMDCVWQRWHKKCSTRNKLFQQWYIYIHIYICMYIYIYIHTYIHTCATVN